MSTLWTRCRDFVEEQAAGEWDDKTIANDADELLKFVMVETQTLRSALNQFVAACETAPPTSLMIEIGMACKAAKDALGVASSSISSNK
jgi:hypothetical protein